LRRCAVRNLDEALRNAATLRHVLQSPVSRVAHGDARCAGGYDASKDSITVWSSTGGSLGPPRGCRAPSLPRRGSAVLRPMSRWLRREGHVYEDVRLPIWRASGTSGAWVEDRQNICSTRRLRATTGTRRSASSRRPDLALRVVS
jgi:hypothetical protein